MFELSISLRPVVGLAEHLAVGDVCRSTLTPSGNVVCIHLGQFPYPGPVGFVSHRAERAVGHSQFSCRLGLHRIDRAFRVLLKDADVQ